jgi:hypothetical protein
MTIMAGNSTIRFRTAAEAQNIPADRFRSAAFPSFVGKPVFALRPLA